MMKSLSPSPFLIIAVIFCYITCFGYGYLSVEYENKNTHEMMSARSVEPYRQQKRKKRERMNAKTESCRLKSDSSICWLSKKFKQIIRINMNSYRNALFALLKTKKKEFNQENRFHRQIGIHTERDSVIERRIKIGLTDPLDSNI